jgi:hypothetical protein
VARETDILRALVDGRLQMCSSPGCSNTFEPQTSKRLCGEPACTRNSRECSAPWCSNRVLRNGSTKGKTVTCSEQCAELVVVARGSLSVRSFERRLTVREAVELMQDMDGDGKLSERFAAVTEAVRSRDNARIYAALLDAGAACLEMAARRGPQ